MLNCLGVPGMCIPVNAAFAWWAGLCCPPTGPLPGTPDCRGFSLGGNEQYRATLTRNGQFLISQVWITFGLKALHLPCSTACMSPFFLLWTCRPTENSRISWIEGALPQASSRISASLCAHLHAGFYCPCWGTCFLFWAVYSSCSRMWPNFGEIIFTTPSSNFSLCCLLLVFYLCLDRHLGPHNLFLTFSLFKHASLEVVPRVNGADYVQGVPSHMLSHSILYAALCHMPCICHVFLHGTYIFPARM